MQSEILGYWAIQPCSLMKEAVVTAVLSQLWYMSYVKFLEGPVGKEYLDMRNVAKEKTQ